MSRAILALAVLSCLAADPANAARLGAPAPPLAKSVAPERAVTIQLEVGQSRTLAMPTPIDKIALDVDGVVSAKVSSARQVTISGARPGRVAIRLSAAGRVQAYDVTVIEEGAAKAEQLRRRLAGQPGLDRIKVEVKNDRTVLSGVVSSLDAHTRALSLAKDLVGGDVSDAMQVAGDRMVAVDIQFYAIDDNTLNQLGVNFADFGSGFQSALIGPSTLQGFNFSPTSLSLNASAPFQNAFNLFLASQPSGAIGVLSALSSAGLSQALAKPTLLVRSGEEAAFLAGGEIPLPVPQGGSASGAITITYKPYGIRLDVAPTVLDDHRIVLKLDAEVSDLDQVNRLSVAGFNVPALRRRSANTTVELGDGESFVIAGLTYATSTTAVDRVPGLGALPVIGALFRRAESTGQRQQLIVVATPHLVRPMVRGALAGAIPHQISAPGFAALIKSSDPAGGAGVAIGLKP